MAKLYKTTDSGAQLLIDRLDIAETTWLRGKGLLGRKGLEQSEALWIKPCNNIHTFFMKFTIDCILMESKMEIRNLKENVRPFRLAGPFWKAHSVIETQAGFVQSKKLKIGDHLYVVS